MIDNPQQPRTTLACGCAGRLPERSDRCSGELRGADGFVNRQAWIAGTWPEFGLP